MYPSEEETKLWVALNRSQRIIYKAIDARLKEEGLPPLRWYDVLWELERTDGAGLRPFVLESKLLFEQSNLSRLIHRMVLSALIEEQKFDGDGRGKVLQITQKGRQTRQQMWEIYGPLIQRHIGRASCTFDRAVVAGALESLID